MSVADKNRAEILSRAGEIVSRRYCEELDRAEGRMTKEQIYDKEIAPALLELCKKCEQFGFSFVANVEWKLGKHGRTESLRKDASFAQLLIHWAARCGGNVDSLIWAIKKHAKEHGHSSVELYLMEERAK